MDKNDFQPRGDVHIEHRAMEPKTLKALAKSPMDNKFRVVLKSKPDLSEQFIRVSLNLSQDFVEFDVIETPKWEVLNWLLSVKNEEPVEGGESITLLSLDENKKGKILCMLQLEGLRLINHECQFAKQAVNPWGVDADNGETLYHDVRISFEKCERVNEQVSV
jgi:hypothetical protein